MQGGYFSVERPGRLRIHPFVRSLIPKVTSCTGRQEVRRPSKRKRQIPKVVCKSELPIEMPKSKQREPVVTQDARFASLHSDPRFLKQKKLPRTIKPDERFNLDLPETSAVDKYGRKKDKKASKRELDQFYQLDKRVKEPTALELARGQVLLESSDEESDDEESDDASDESDGELVQLGQQAESSSSEFSVNLDEDDVPLLSEGEEHEITSKRLAAVNMDWDHLKAIDIYKVFASVFLKSKTAGKLLKVSI